MKRATIIIFTLLLALLAGTATLDARTCRHSSSSSCSRIPDAKKVIGCEFSSANEVKAKLGLDLLYSYEKSWPHPEVPDFNCFQQIYYYGKDAKLIKKGDKITVKANGPHAFYYYF